MLTPCRNELYKVLDSSDVILHILDARDPLGTRCRSVEKYLRTEAPHKHLVFILNKCDLVPASVAVSKPRLSFSPFLHPSPTRPVFSQGTSAHESAAVGAIRYSLGRVNCHSCCPLALGPLDRWSPSWVLP